MEKSKSIVVFLYLVVLLNISISCKNSLPEYRDCLASFDKFYSKKGILEHFPEETNSIRRFYCYSLSKEVNFAEIYLSTNSNSQEIARFKSMKYQIVDLYNSEKFFCINIDLIRDSSNIYATKIDRLNDMIAIGDFEQTNFGIGEYKDTLKLNNGVKCQVIEKYIVPEDLKVYVIESVSGDYFANEVERSTRYSLLEKWKNGYSRGIAISEKYNIVLFWLIVW